MQIGQKIEKIFLYSKTEMNQQLSRHTAAEGVIPFDRECNA